MTISLLLDADVLETGVDLVDGDFAVDVRWEATPSHALAGRRNSRRERVGEERGSVKASLGLQEYDNKVAEQPRELGAQARRHQVVP